MVNKQWCSALFPGKLCDQLLSRPCPKIFHWNCFHGKLEVKTEQLFFFQLKRCLLSVEYCPPSVPVNCVPNKAHFHGDMLFWIFRETQNRDPLSWVGWLTTGWSNTGTGFLKRWSMPQACQCLRGVWTTFDQAWSGQAVQLVDQCLV